MEEPEEGPGPPVVPPEEPEPTSLPLISELRPLQPEVSEPQPRRVPAGVSQHETAHPCAGHSESVGAPDR